MIPLLLSLRGFLSYYQPVEIDFTSIEVACISGPNGAGKSSIFDAITWALFGVARKSDDAIIHSHPKVKAAEVELIFEYEDNLYRVQRIRPRNATTRLEFQVASPETVPETLDRESLSQIRWRSLTERTLRDTQALIHHLLRLDYETFTNASFFLQGKADQFTTQTPANRKRILGSILGLEVWEEYRARAAERRKRLETEIEFIERSLAEIQRELSEEPARRLRLEEVERQLAAIHDQRRVQAEQVAAYRQQIAVLEEQKRALGELHKRVEALEQNYGEVMQRLQERRKELDSYQALLGRAAQIEADYQEYQALQSQLQAFERAFMVFADLERQLQSLQAELDAERARLAQKVLHLEESQKRAELARENLVVFQRQLAAIEKQLREKEDELALCLQAEQEWQLLRERIQEHEGQNKHRLEEMKKLRSRIDALQSETGDAICPLCGQPLSPEDRRSLIQSLEEEGKALKEQYLATQAQIAQWKGELTMLQKQAQLRAGLEKSLRQLEGEKERWMTKLNAEEEIWREWERSGAAHLEELRSHLQNETFLPHLREQMTQVMAQIQALGYEHETHAKLRQMEGELRPVLEEYQALLQARAVVGPLGREIEELERQAQALSQQREDLLQAWCSAQSLLEQAERQAPDLFAAEKELQRLEEEERECNRQLGVARQLVDVLDDLKKRAQNLERERSEKAILISRYKALERAFGKDGIPALIIEQALPQIEERANRILYRLSDGKMSLRFSTQMPYKDARRQDLRETLQIQISDSNGIRDYELFSGGEAFRINFALRLAIAELLAQRAGARLQTLVIDEGFGSQDAQGRQYLIEAIHRVRNQFAKILIITHLDDLKDAFPTRLEVEKTPQGSMVRIV